MSVTHLAPRHATHPVAVGQQQARVAGNSKRPNSNVSRVDPSSQFQQELASQLDSSHKATSNSTQQASGGATDTSYNGWNPTTGTISPAVADIAARDAYFGQSPGNDLALVSAVTNIPVTISGDFSNPVQLTQPAPQPFLNALNNPGVTYSPNTGYVVNTSA